MAGDSRSNDGPPVRLTGRREIARNGKWVVHFDDIEDAAGRRVENYVSLAGVAAPADLVMGVAVLPVHGDKIGLLSMYRHPVERDTLELVKGFIDRGEMPGEAARRELLEETGCIAGSLVSLGHVTPEASTLASRSALFLAVDAVVERPPADEDIGLGPMRWYDLDEALAMIERSEIEDSYTVICLLRCDRLRRAAGR